MYTEPVLSCKMYAPFAPAGHTTNGRCCKCCPYRRRELFAPPASISSSILVADNDDICQLHQLHLPATTWLLDFDGHRATRATCSYAVDHCNDVVYNRASLEVSDIHIAYLLSTRDSSIELLCTDFWHIASVVHNRATC